MASEVRKLRAVRAGKGATRTRTAATRGRPKTRLTSAVGSNGSEREMLVILRNKIAAKLDGDVPATSFAQLLRQFDQYDRRIRAIDAREAEANADDGDDLDDDDGDASWDPESV
jgi:hypothetical protein